MSSVVRYIKGSCPKCAAKLITKGLNVDWRFIHSFLIHILVRIFEGRHNDSEFFVTCSTVTLTLKFTRHDWTNSYLARYYEWSKVSDILVLSKAGFKRMVDF